MNARPPGPGGAAPPGPAPDDPPDHDAPEAPAPGAPAWAALARVWAGEAALADGGVPVREPEGPELDADARRWLAAHPDEAARLTALGRLVDAALAPDAGAPAPDVEAALARVTRRRLAGDGSRDPAPGSQQIAPAWAARPGPPARRRRLVVGAAALAVAGVAVARWWGARDSARTLAEVEPVPAHYATGVGRQATLRLPDGTTVVLGPSSTLDLAPGYAAGTRQVTLAGEAYFAVPHDTAQPFVVRAGPATVHDLGTAFVVRQDGDRVTVAVTQGLVRLAPTPTAAPRPAQDSGLVLRAGERGAVTAPAGRGRRALTVRLPGLAADDTTWTSGRLVFRDAPLAEVSGALRRWYGVDLRPADSAAAGRHLTATFRGEPLPDVLRVISLALGARLNRRGDTVFVSAAR